LLNDHGDPHHNRRDIEWVFCRKIQDPHEEGCMPHLNCILKGIIEGDKDRDLNEHGKATAHGVDLPSFVEQHDFLLNPSLVVLIGLFEPVHLWLDLLHLFHRFHANLRQWKEDDFDQDTEEDNVNPKVFCDGVGEL